MSDLTPVMPGALVALFSYGHAGNVDCPVGVALAHRIAPRTLRMLFCLVLSGTAAASLLRHWAAVACLSGKLRPSACTGTLPLVMTVRAARAVYRWLVVIVKSVSWNI